MDGAGVMKEKSDYYQMKYQQYGKRERPSVLFILPVRGGSGGAHSIVQETLCLRKMNVPVNIAVRKKDLQSYLTLYPEAVACFKYYFQKKELYKMAKNYKIVIATIYSSVDIVKKIIKKHPTIQPAYYIQDYEPWFFKKEDKRYKLAENSYTSVANMHAFAKTKWLCNIVEEKHGLPVNKVEPSLDHHIFQPPKKRKFSCNHVTITAMVRPSTPRRSPKETLAILNKVKKRYGERVRLAIFGCTDEELAQNDLQTQHIKNYGVLSSKEVCALFQQTDIFIDLSIYQAFGRTGLEAMAVGCCTLLPEKGGVTEYAKHKENCFLIDVNDVEGIMHQVDLLISNQKVRERLSKNAMSTAKRYSVNRAALSLLALFHSILQVERNNKKRKKI